MGLDFVKQLISIGGATTEPALRFYRKGFNLGGSGGIDYRDIVLSGNGSLTLANAKANGLNYLKLFGGCEQIASGNVGTAYIANTTTEVTGDITNVPRTDISTPAVSLLKSGNITTDNIPDVDWTKDWELLVKNTKITAINDIGNAISVCIDRSVAIQIYPYSGGKLCGACYIDGTQTSYSVDTITLNTNYDFRISYEERSGLRAIWIDYKLSSSDTWTPLLQKNITLTQPSVSYIGLSSRWNDKIPMPINLSNVTFTNDGVVKYSSSASSTPTPDAPMDIVCNNGALKVRHQSGLPLGYQPYEYITASGTQWLNTGVKLESTDVVEAEFKNSSTTGFGALYGVFALGDSSAFYANGTYYGYDVSNGKVDTRVSVDTNWHTLRHDFVNGVITLDGNDTTYTPFEFDNAKDNYLFARYYSNSYGYGFKGSCKRYKVIRNGVLICDLIPAVQLSDNPTVGMYDLVNDVFRDNIGSGSFTITNPINDLELYVDGTVETVGIEYNAFTDVGKMTGYIVNIDTGAITVNANYNVSAPIRLTTGDYRVSYYTPATGSRPFCIWECDAQGNVIGSTKIFGIGRPVVGTNTGTFTIDRDMFVLVSWRLDFTNIEIAIPIPSATATAEPLLAIGDYKDVQNVTNGNIARNVSIKILDGTENWVDAATSSTIRYRASISDAVGGSSRSEIICSHFNYISTGQDVGGAFLSTKYLYLIPAQTVTTVADFQAWLADQYNAGTPVIVVYPLATATTESVTAQHLSIQAGTNIVEITQASIDNLPLEVSYKGTV